MTAGASPVRALVLGSSHLVEAVLDELRARGATIVGDATATPDAVLLCDDDDAANIAEALTIRATVPDARIVLRSFNTRIQEHLPLVLGDCHVLSASALSARPLCDLAVGAGQGSGVVDQPRRPARPRPIDRIAASHGAAVWRQLWRRPIFRGSLAAVLVLVLVQSLLAHAVHGHGALAAAHAGVAAVLTLGFADAGLLGASLAREPAWLQGAALGTALTDIVLFTVLLGIVADALVSERFARVFGGSARRLRGHVVIAGLGTVGYRLLLELQARGYPCAVIESDPEGQFVAAARRSGAFLAISDARQAEEFGQLSLERAVAFLAVTDDDAVNIEAAFTASAIAPDLRIVVRCFEPHLAARLEALPGIAASRSVARLAAPSFVDAAGVVAPGPA